MAKKLVIVESPAKAKTIKRFLGADFDVHASVGHVADLPSKGLAVDVDNHFEPTYELTERGKQVVRELKARLKEADELYLATDEDREGEAISWHLLRALEPSVPVKRMVFHEITQAAIDAALANPRDVDQGLVDAAETRRILDRLYGYEVSPVLWRRVNRGLSAGRVQSPTVRLIVERERERRAFVKAAYWSVELRTGTEPAFTANLVALDGSKVATGKDFDNAGGLRAGVVVVDGARAEGLAERLGGADFQVRSVEDKPYTSSPRAPFMTSTLQQEGSRKLRLSAAQVMRVAQGLYERGYITYMRTDSVELSREARDALRGWVKSKYGPEYLPPSPRAYRSKVQNAQEAHEAIRPTVPLRLPEEIASELNRQELALYRLVWQRSLASQMADAKGTTVSVRIGAVAAEPSGPVDCEFAASGTTITFQGYRRVYVEAREDGAEAEREALLPPLAQGDRLPVESVTANGHETTPPTRYTEASIVKRLDELGIGRPSTWASIIQTVQDRGYVWKKGQALVPTWTAFAVVGLMERHFDELVDYAFTARVEADLDAIARREMDKEGWLRQFYLGDQQLLGLKKLVEQNLDEIDAAEINTFELGPDPESGQMIVVKPGRYGPYVKRGESTASVPEELPPDELTLEVALGLLAAPKADEPIGEIDGYPVFAKNGRYGPYVQLGTADEPPPGHEKPKMSSLFGTMSLESITLDDAKALLSLPRPLGEDPADGEPILANNGRYGPYVQKGRDFRSIDSEAKLLTITLEEALALLAQPKVYRRGGRGTAKPPLRELGEDPISGRPVVAKEGRFGIYVTDGETNASLGRGDRIEEMTKERAWELLAIRREATTTSGGGKKAKGKASKKKTTKKAKKTSKKKASASGSKSAKATAGRKSAKKASKKKG